MPHVTPLPGEPAPALAFDRIGADPFALDDTRIDQFLLLLFYRGQHCPICRDMLEELNGRIADFRDAGMDVVPVSMDTRERAEKQVAEWDVGGLAIGYGMSEREARSFGLFITERWRDHEPERYSEPGLVVLRPNRTIFAMFLQSVPFTRPSFDGLLKGLTFVQDKGYPTRGSVPAA